MNHLKKSVLLLGAMMITLLMSVGVFASDDIWTNSDVTNSSIGVSKQTAEIKSLSYIADKGISLNVTDDKFSINSAGFNSKSEVYVSNSVENEADLNNVTYNKVTNGYKTGVLYFDAKKINVRYVNSYFNVKVVTGNNTSIIKVKTTVNYGDLYVYAFQMNTNHNEGGVSEFNPSYRVVNYCGNVLANGNNLIPVKGFGTVYGIDGTFTKDDLVKNSTNNKVYSFDATEQGLVDVKGATQWDNYYAVTFKNLSYNPELLDRSYTLRPYAILEDGSIMYSDDVQSTSIYDVANVLYERNAMSTKEARDFLLKHILNIVKIKNGYADVCKDMLKVLNVTDTNNIDYKYVNTLYKDLFYYVQLTHDYTVDHYYNRGDFVAKTFVDGKDLNTELLDKLNKASGTNYDTISDYIKFESPKHGVEGSYVPAGVYVDNKLIQEWTDLVKNGDVLVDDDTLKSVSNNVKGDLVLPETVKKVESANGSGLDTITIPSTVEEIKDDAFSNVPEITYNGDATGAPWKAENAFVKGENIDSNAIYVGYNTTNKTLYFANKESEIKDAGVNLTSSNYYGNIANSCNYSSSSARPWNSIAKEIVNVKILSEIKPTSCACWFDYMSQITSLDLTNLNTENCTNMSNMFNGCNKLTSLNVSNFDTSNVTNISGMFSSCSSLTTLDVSNFDTSKITDMSCMFEDCSKLESLNVSNFDTSKVTDMSCMFESCSSLTSLDVSNFDTSKVTNMSKMFFYCKSLTTLNLNDFNTINVKNMSNMFNNCITLTTLNIGNFNTNNVTNMDRMFYDCGQNVPTTINLGSFNPTKVSNYSSIFGGMNSNDVLYVGSDGIQDWVLKKGNSSWVKDVNVKVICTSEHLDHNWINESTKAPTCTTVGEKTEKCSYCGKTKTTVLNALGHSWNDGIITKEATCTAAGEKLYTCTRNGCNATKTEAISALGHNFQVTTDNDGNKKWVCSNCREQKEYKKYEISIVNNTNYIQSDNKFTSNIKNVNNGKASIELKLTVYEETNFEFKYKVSSEKNYDKGTLVVAGTTVANAISGTTTAEQTYTKTFTPGTYTVTSQYTKDSSGNSGDDCFYFTINEKHNWDSGTITKEATCTTTGIKTYTCIDNGCNATKTETIAALGHNYNSNDTCTVCGKKSPVYVYFLPSNNQLYFVSSYSKVPDVLKKTQYCYNIEDYYKNPSSPPWKSQTATKQIIINDNIKLKTCAYLFRDLTNVENITGLEKLDLTECTNTCWMFYNCGHNGTLKSLDVSELDTSHVQNMSEMFYGVGNYSGISLTFGGKFNTSSVTDMSGMFAFNDGIKTLDLTSFDTSNVETMEGMFQRLTGLTSLNIKNFTYNKCKNTKAMFASCGLISGFDLNLGNGALNSVSNNSSIFAGTSRNITIYTNSQDVKDWILGLDSSTRPSAWTTNNIIVQ